MNSLTRVDWKIILDKNDENKGIKRYYARVKDILQTIEDETLNAQELRAILKKHLSDLDI